MYNNPKDIMAAYREKRSDLERMNVVKGLYKKGYSAEKISKILCLKRKTVDRILSKENS